MLVLVQVFALTVALSSSDAAGDDAVRRERIIKQELLRKGLPDWAGEYGGYGRYMLIAPRSGFYEVRPTCMEPPFRYFGSVRADGRRLELRYAQTSKSDQVW
jgi:hypothetical protein